MSSRRQMHVLESPGINEAKRLVREALAQRRTLILVGECQVDYKGRASSKLEPGDRMVIIKEDGSVLVHRPTGYEAVNWQPPGCVFHSSVRDQVLWIMATRRKPVESIRIAFSCIYLASTMKLKDEGEFSLHASEEEMQKAILLKPSLLERGFRPTSFEKKVEPGFLDVCGIDRDGRLVVVEIKRRIAGRDAVMQLFRYVKAVKQNTNRTVRGVLVAPGIAKGTQKLLASLGLSFKSLDPRDCAEVLTGSREGKLPDFFES